MITPKIAGKNNLTKKLIVLLAHHYRRTGHHYGWKTIIMSMADRHVGCLGRTFELDISYFRRPYEDCPIPKKPKSWKDKKYFGKGY